MSGLARWGRFSLAGAVGIVLQFTSFSLLNRLLGGHYLIAAAIAVELTLLHNFIWHWLYTWNDRRNEFTFVRSLIGFHLSNGLVSMLGNIAFMRP